MRQGTFEFRLGRGRGLPGILVLVVGAALVIGVVALVLFVGAIVAVAGLVASVGAALYFGARRLLVQGLSTPTQDRRVESHPIPPMSSSTPGSSSLQVREIDVEVLPSTKQP